MSTSRHCSIEHAIDKTWFVFLGQWEHDERTDSDCFGPFPDYDTADDFISNGPHSNPGCVVGGPSAPPTLPVPATSPNGGKIILPRKLQGRWVVEADTYTKTGPLIIFHPR